MRLRNVGKGACVRINGGSLADFMMVGAAKSGATSTLDEYAALPSRAKPGTLLGEASTSYLFTPELRTIRVHRQKYIDVYLDPRREMCSEVLANSQISLKFTGVFCGFPTEFGSGWGVRTYPTSLDASS